MKFIFGLIIFCFLNFISVFAQDTIPPKIDLKGEPGVILCRWEEYKDEGYIVSDNIDTVINIDTSSEYFQIPIKTGNDELVKYRFKATDKSGNFSYSEYRYVLTNTTRGYNSKGKACFQISISDRNYSENQIFIYPNPTSNFIQINSTIQIQSISIYSIDGKCLLNSNPNKNNSAKIDLKHFSDGLYMVKVETLNGILVKRIQVIH